jgi:hypothetical protein
MRKLKSFSAILALLSVSLVACGNSYESYSDCFLETMKGLDPSMQVTAMEACEIKHPYEKKIYWKNKVHFEFSSDPNHQKVLFKIDDNRSKYRITKIDVSGNHLPCASIPDEPNKPNLALFTDYYEQAKIELNFDETETVIGVDKVQTHQEQIKRLPEESLSEENISPRETNLEDDPSANHAAENYLESLREKRRLWEEQIRLLDKQEELQEKELKQRKKEVDHWENFALRAELVSKRADELKSLDDKRKTTDYELKLKEYKKANSFWSPPVQVEINKNGGETDSFGLAPYSGTLDKGGPRCVRFIDVYGIRRN